MIRVLLATLTLLLCISHAHAQRVIPYSLSPTFALPEISADKLTNELQQFEQIYESVCNVNLVRTTWPNGTKYVSGVASLNDGSGRVALGLAHLGYNQITIHNGTRNGGKTDYWRTQPGLIAAVFAHELWHILRNNSNHSADANCIMNSNAVARKFCPAEVAVLQQMFGKPASPPIPPSPPQPPAPVYQPGTFLLAAANANVRFGDGSGIGLVGRWKDGKWGLGTYNPATSVFSGRFSLTSGPPEFAFQFGSPGLGLQPVIADYDFDGSDNVGVYNPSTGRFLFRKTLAPGKADYDVTYGPVGGAMAVSGLGVGVYVKQQ